MEPKRRYQKGRTPEGLLKRAVKAHLERMGYFVENNFQGIGCTSGRPDMEASKHGVTIRIETKRPDYYIGNRHYPEGLLRPDQIAYIAKLAAHGIITIVTADLDCFCRELEQIEERLWPDRAQRRLIGG